MSKTIIFVSIGMILFGLEVLTQDYIYDSLIGGSVNVNFVRYPLSIGFIAFGLMLLYSEWRKRTN
jgi:hypothetical protein